MTHFPIYAELYLSDRCNLHCTYCYVEQAHKSAELSFEEWVRVLDELTAEKVFGVLFSGGEPWVRADFGALIAEAVKRKMRFSITTNATLLTPERVAEILPFLGRCNQIQISVDGPEAIHDLARGQGSFQRMAHGVHLLQAAGFPLTARMTVGKHNMRHLMAAADTIFGELKIPYCGINQVTNLLGQQVDLVPDLEDLRIFLADCPKVFQRWPNRFLADGPWMGYRQWQKILAKSAEKPDFFRCQHEKDRLCILANGDVVHCRVLTETPAGNCRQEALATLWQRLDAHGICEAPECHTCEFHDHCPGRCNCAEGMCLKRFLDMGGSPDELAK